MSENLISGLSLESVSVPPEEVDFVLPLSVRGQVTHLIALSNDRTARPWQVFHSCRLRILGESYAKAIIHRRAQERLLKNERHLTEAQRIANVVSWQWDVCTGELNWSGNVRKLMNVLDRSAILSDGPVCSILGPNPFLPCLNQITIAISTYRR